MVEVVSELADLVSITMADEDQSQSNFDVILSVVDTASDVVSNATFDDEDLISVGTQLFHIKSSNWFMPSLDCC